MKFFRKSKKVFLGEYSGSILEYAWISVALMSGLIVAEIVFWVLYRETIWVNGWISFWTVKKFSTFGILLIISFSLIPWLIVPNIMFLLNRTSSGYLSYPFGDRMKSLMLVLTTFLFFIIAIIIAPSLTIQFTYWGVISWLLYLIGLIPISSFCVYVVRYGKLLFRRRKLGYPRLYSFRSKLRPVNSKVINLDVGALAPRLVSVSNALIAWSRVAEGSAPTAKLYWDTISKPRNELPKGWRKNLKSLAFTNIEDFRNGIAGLVNVDPNSIIFVTSTTRALSLAMNSIDDFDSIITTSYEHPSEYFVFNKYNKVKKIEINQINLDLILNLSSEEFRAHFIQAFLTQAKLKKRPLCVVSEVPYCFGIKLPVSDLSKALRAECPEAVLIIDGAHAVGQYDINLSERDFDYYLFSGHKWLFGPAGLGILVIGSNIKQNPEIISRLHADAFESLSFWGSKLGEAGSTISLDPFVGLAEVIKIMTPEVRTHMFDNIVDLRTLFDKMAALATNFEIIVPPQFEDDSIAHGIVNVQGKNRILGFDTLVRVRDRLEDSKDIVLKVINDPLSLRICIPFYLERYELERVVDSLEDVFGMKGK